MIVGVDNGLDGGLCAISEDGLVIDKIVMPTKWVLKKREIDTTQIKQWLLFLNTPFLLAVEEPLAHAKSSQAIRSMALSFGKLCGMAETSDFEMCRVSVHKWQKKMLGFVPKGMTKEKAIKRAQQLAPDECWTKNKRCRKAHDGMVDAFLIATYILKTKKV